MAIIQNKPNMNYGVWGSNGNIAVPTSEKVDLGWIIEKPPNEMMNWVQNRQDSMLQFINQRGIPTWDALTEYAKDSYTVRNGILYKAVSQNTDKDPTLNSAIWNISFASQTDYTNLYNDVQKIKNQKGYLSDYVQKSAPVMTADAKGIGYKNSTGVSGLTFSGVTPQISVSNEVVAAFKKLTSTQEDSNFVATTAWVQDLIESLGTVYAPTGSVVAMATRVVPIGYLECNGNTVSRATYSKLFSVIGTTFGIGDGSTTFNLPDLRGEFIRGFDSGKGVDASRNFGSGQSESFKSHNHVTDSRYNKLSARSADVDFAGTAGSIDTGASDLEYRVGNMSSTQWLAATIKTEGGAETRPRNVSLLYIIKT